MATESRSNFWRRSAKVPGRSHKDTSKVNSLKAKKASSFHEFAHSTNDAWDLDDEEDEEPLRGPAPSATPPDVSVQTEENKQHLNGKVGRSMSDARLTPPQSRSSALSQSAPSSRWWRVSPTRMLRESAHGRAGQKSPGQIQAVAGESQHRPGPPGETFRCHQCGSCSGVHLLTLALLFFLCGANRRAPQTQLVWNPARGPTNHVEASLGQWPPPASAVIPQGYLPTNRGRRELVLQRKREEYFAFIEQYYQSRTEEHYRDTHRQIHIDIPRTNPLIPLFQQPLVQEVFERILFIWAIRHPASGYVQGINDLVTPFFVVFLSEFVTCAPLFAPAEDVENFEMSALPLQTQRSIEADTFWCMSKLLDGIQDNYTFAQPGIQNKVKALEELVSRIDGQFLQLPEFQASGWTGSGLVSSDLGGPWGWWRRCWCSASVCCLSSRGHPRPPPEAEAEGFSHFHLYVCAAFLLEWRKQILSTGDFQGLLMLLQNLPTIHWGNEEVGLLLAEAYRLKYMFADAPSHYRR
ncbi:unnamed protein product, partial [Tetraodon nigroviridis]